MFGNFMGYVRPQWLRIPHLGFFRDTTTESSGEFDIARFAFYVILFLFALFGLTLVGIVWYTLLVSKTPISVSDFGNASAALLGSAGGSVLAACAGVGIRAHLEDKVKQNETRSTTVTVETAGPVPDQTLEGQSPGPQETGQ